MVHLDHIGIKVAQDDLEATITFYSAALAPLGYKVAMRFGSAVGFSAGEKTRADFWVTGQPEKPNTCTHVAFASTRANVDAFHAEALKAGAKDNGAPGVRQHYHKDYYGAFAYDPAGNNIEVVCHEPAEASQ